MTIRRVSCQVGITDRDIRLIRAHAPALGMSTGKFVSMLAHACACDPILIERLESMPQVPAPYRLVKGVSSSCLVPSSRVLNYRIRVSMSPEDLEAVEARGRDAGAHLRQSIALYRHLSDGTDFEARAVLAHWVKKYSEAEGISSEGVEGEGI